MKKQTMKIIALTATAILAFACGGGGGSGSEKTYSGTWRVSALKVRDDCGVSQTTFNTDVVVNQDGNRVVVNSGVYTLSGNTTDKDGFLVSTENFPYAGCVAGVAYSFENASDGNAAAGIALALVCGTRTCVVAFGGSAAKLDGRSAETGGAASQDDVDEGLNEIVGRAENMPETDSPIEPRDLVESHADEAVTLR